MPVRFMGKLGLPEICPDFYPLAYTADSSARLKIHLVGREGFQRVG